jgi:hypothetical protein
MFHFILILIAGITFGLSLNAMENNNSENAQAQTPLINKQGSPVKDQQNLFNQKMANEWRKQANRVAKIAFNIDNDASLSATQKGYFAAGLEADIKDKLDKSDRFAAARDARRQELNSKKD